MKRSKPRSPATATEPVAVAPLPSSPPQAELSDRDDGTSRDPADYDWVPVRRKPRRDGWSPLKQRVFIETLADTGSVATAASAIGMTERSCYRLRREPGSESFCAAWSAAVEAASKRLIDEAFQRALVGSDEPVFNRDGERVGRRFRQSDRLLMFLLRAYMPERFGHPANSGRKDGGSQPVATALRSLGPEIPQAPHLLMAPDQLETALLCADITPGKLPHWHGEPDLDGEPPPPPAKMPLGEEFERALENAKRNVAGRPPFTDAEWQSHLTMLG